MAMVYKLLLIIDNMTSAFPLLIQSIIKGTVVSWVS